MKNWFKIAVPVVVFVTIMVVAQAKNDPPKYEPKPEQLKSLAYKQHVAVYAQQSMQAEAQKLPQWADWQKAVADLLTECKAVAKENKWPETVTCDPQTLLFDVPKVAATPPVTKP